MVLRTLTPLAFIACFAFVSPANASWSLFIAAGGSQYTAGSPIDVTVGTTTQLVFNATNTYGANQNLSVNSGFGLPFTLPASGTNITSNGINGVINLNPGLDGAGSFITVADGQTVTIATMDFTNVGGGTGSNPLFENFQFAAFVTQSSAPFFQNVVFDFAVTAVPEPATAATFGLMVGSAMVYRRRRSDIS